jgi:hypothetical protein
MPPRQKIWSSCAGIATSPSNHAPIPVANLNVFDQPSADTIFMPNVANVQAHTLGMKIVEYPDPAAPPKPTVEPPQVKGTDFSWTNEEAVVLREQRQTAIYWNPDGDLVLRQRADWDEANDPYLVIGANNLQDFIDAICDMAGIGSAGRREPSSRS